MSLYLLPKTERQRVPEILSDGGSVAIRWMDDGPLSTDAARWWRFTCSEEASWAAGCIGEYQELPEMIVVSVGVDLRRMLLLWRLPGDLSLVRRLTRILEGAGA